MKRTLFQKVLCFVLSVTILLGMTAITASAASLKGNDTSSEFETMQKYLKASAYSTYYAKYHPNGTNPYFKSGLGEVNIPVTSFTGEASLVKDSDKCNASYNADSTAWSTFGDFATLGAQTVYLPTSGSATWNFSISEAQASLYNIKIEYYTCQTSESSVSSIERKLYLDGGFPFTEASNLKLTKNWEYVNSETVAAPADAETGVTYEQTDKGYIKRVVYETATGKEMTLYTIAQDINGNSMTPDAEQYPEWRTYYAEDASGYTQGYFEFYFEQGNHTLTLEAEREPMIVKSITLVPIDSAEFRIKSYAEVQSEYAAHGYTAPANGKITQIEAEFPDFVSDSSVAATNDNSSCETFPSRANAQLFNVIGENSYNTVGQWAAYKFTVSETGLYKLGMRYKQTALEGMYICRTIKLSGGAYGLADGTPTVPFAEAYDAQFNYNKEWQSSYVGDSKGNEFTFYFEEGVEYVLYLECSLGSLKELIARAAASLASINADYLKILQYTGSDPDTYREYDFKGTMPEVLVDLLDQAIALAELADEFEALCGGKGSHIATLDSVSLLLDRMGKNNGMDVAANLATLKSNLGTLGTWINDSQKGGMIVDTIRVIPASADAKALPKAKAGFFKSAWFEIKSFISSVFTDYDEMGLTVVPDANENPVQVWLASGRDQSKIWRSMIDATGGYTDLTGNAVTLKLVTGGTLLPSILSGKGPDVYLGLSAADVINYAIRDAVVGVSGGEKKLGSDNAIFTSTVYTYKDENGRVYTTETPEAGKTASFVSHSFTDTVNGNYAKAAMDTVTLLDVSYGIPMTMNFSMMFYRTDILTQLNKTAPETWDELLELVPVLQANNMAFGVHYENQIKIMLYQMGSNMWKYTDNSEYAGAKVALDTDLSYEAFSYVCRLYTDYSFPVTYDAANRFRTGEIPILVQDYISVYNQLVVFATEIEGLWNMCSVPGFKSTNKATYGEYDEWNDTDGYYYNYDSCAAITATVMLYGCSDVLSAWQFMQWQTSATVQANYGNRMVALIGPSAKYETANINAIKNLSWSAAERAALEDQIAHLSSVVNYPGSYIIDRYTKFAFLNAKNDAANPVDALRQYIDAINAEIKRKREEFDLKTLEPDEEPDYLKK
ncbi:MAG: extracellular solute-binding protein [Clostridia bacterium]|nr:extracellular solute-binding protein [Clostridia bacterium]